MGRRGARLALAGLLALVACAPAAPPVSDRPVPAVTAPGAPAAPAAAPPRAPLPARAAARTRDPALALTVRGGRFAGRAADGLSPDAIADRVAARACGGPDPAILRITPTATGQRIDGTC